MRVIYCCVLELGYCRGGDPRVCDTDVEITRR